MKTILFVCSANIIRSAMAEAWFNHLAKDNPNLTAVSAGITAFPGDSATEYAIKATKAHGIDLSNHRSRRLDGYITDQADYIFAATEKHAQFIKEHFPECADKIALFNTHADINYPALDSENQHHNCFSTIKHSVETIYQKLAGEL